MTTDNSIASYQNGNTRVTLYDDGTKTREYEGIPAPEFPESIDIKITNYCDLVCPYCHESSGIRGAHASLPALLRKLSGLPAGVELAIGGGNPLAHPLLASFLLAVQQRGWIANITVNQKHLHFTDLTRFIGHDLVNGVGVSIREEGIGDPRELRRLRALSPHIVYHVICGVHKSEIIDELLEIDERAKILVLGYKQYGRGLAHHSKDIDDEIVRWSRYLPRYIDRCHLSFDNLAIEQLDIKRLFTKEGWERFYMGDDFTFSMYIDAVEKVFAPTSRSAERRGWAGCSLKKFFRGEIL